MNLGTMSNTEQNPVGEFFVDLLRASQKGLNLAKIPWPLEDTKLGDIAIKDIADYAEELSYGDSSGTGSGMTYRPDDRSLDLTDLATMGLGAVVTKPIKGLVKKGLKEIAGPMPPNYMTPGEFGDIDIPMTKLAEAAHLARGGTGYLHGAGTYKPSDEEILSKLADYRNEVKLAKMKDPGNPDYFTDEVIDAHERLGDMGIENQALAELMESSKYTLQKPLYVVKESSAEIPKDLPSALLSTRVVDPANIKSYSEPYFSMDIDKIDPDTYKMYKMNSGDVTMHPKSNADKDETLFNSDTLKDAKSIDVKKFIEMMKQGIDPLSLIQQMQSAQYA